MFSFSKRRPPKIKNGRQMTAEEITRGILLRGKTALVTGAGSGLGFETMRVLSMRGVHVIAACRTQETAEQACNLIAGKTTPLACDLSDLESVGEAVESLLDNNVPLDMVICNAGVLGYPKNEQFEGLDLHFRVNHLGHFALTTGILPLLKAAEQGRVVMVASNLHRIASRTELRFENLSGEAGGNGMRAYALSKLANLLFMSELAKRTEGSAVTVNAASPGMVQTRLFRNAGRTIKNVSNRFGHFVMRTPAQGAATQCYLATHPKLSKVSGYYFVDCNAKTPGKLARNPEMAAELWNMSQELVKKADIPTRSEELSLQRT